MAPNSSSEDVRARLRVAYYIEGSVREASDMLRVVVQLIDSASGFHVVSRSFDRPRRDFFQIQDEITSLAVANLRVALPEATRQSLLVPAVGPNLDAYLLYRAGMDALYGPRTQDSIDSALDAFGQALEVDADYAAAHAGLCMTHVSAYSLNAEARSIDAAEQSCAAALTLNANLDVVHNALGELYLRTGEYEEAETAFERALGINTKAVDSMIGLGRVYMNQQRSAEAEEIYAQAIGLQPGNWEAYNAFGGFLYLTGRYEDAAAQYREVVAIDAENMTGWSNLASALLLSGGFAEAASAFERANDVRPTPTAYANLGLLHYYLGEYRAAADSLEAATRLAPNDYLVWSNLGDVLSFSPDPREAREAFQRAEALAEGQLRVNSRDPQTTANLAWIKAMLGDLGEAQRLIAAARSAAAEDPYVHYIEALVLVKRGELTAALDRLATAAQLGYPRALMAAEPHLGPLRSAEPFKELVGE
ncbi:MAG TPA: tetratricopeptide repeat protein, partial [Gammaproteobacteria bacterium]|nr:tetratricopeptide repeat protein [Gammaproteobacteria bacterium]